MAGVLGLEPRVPVLETGGLPLTDTPMYWRELPDSNGRVTGLQPAALSIFAKFPGGPERGT